MPGAAPKILIIEDTATLAHLFLIALERIGLNAYYALNGEEALQLIQSVRPDLILLDLNLPGMHGWEVLSKIREQLGNPAPKVIVVTVQGDSDNYAKAHDIVVDRYLVKPVTPRHLIEIIGDVLNLNFKK